MKTTPRLQTMDLDRKWFEANLQKRFLRYGEIFTTSDSHSPTCPSTVQQWDLARLLDQELKEFGLSDVQLTQFGYVIAQVPATPGFEHFPTIGFCAHMDTSPDSPGDKVKPKVWENYDGKPISLANGITLNPAQNPEMLKYLGQTIITSDGTTLLGADDKAGIAEIMTAIEYLLEHTEFVHGPLEIIFTPDEEIGRGVDKLDVKSLKSTYAYTLDGSTEGTYNDQCFNAFAIEAVFQGRMIHPGTARGIMVNAVAMAGAFITGLPRSEAPETTDGDYGFYCPQEITGRMDQAKCNLFIRDFDEKEIQRRLDFLRQLALTIEGSFPGGTVTLTIKQQYLNLFQFVSREPKGLNAMIQGIRETGIEPIQESIRGGTDGARLSEQGLPTPNIFAGGHNFHSVEEWIGLPAMVRAAKTIINISRIWTE